MLQPFVYCFSLFGMCLGRSFSTDIMDMWMKSCYADGSANWARWILCVRSDVSCQLCRESQKGGQCDWCCYQLYFVCLVTTLCTVEIDNLTAHTQAVRSDGQVIGVTSQKGDLNDSVWWYNQLNWTVCVLDTRLHTVEIEKIGCKYSMYKIAHAKHWDMHMSSSERVHCQWT